MFISVFGGSQPQVDSPAYEQAYTLGAILAEAGHTVLTGGYMGTMEAVSKGANEAGGRVIGVSCNEIERWRPVKPNPWVNEEWRKETLIERMQALILECDASIALPGGPGTFAEIALTWNLMIIGAVTPRPLILVGNCWQAILHQVYHSLDSYIPSNQRALIKLAPDVESAARMLVQG